MGARRERATWYGPGFYGRRTACGQTMSRTLVGARFAKAGRMYFFEPGPVSDYRVNDWIIVRTDGAFTLDVRLVLKTDDGALIARVRTEMRDMCGLTAELTFMEVNRWMKAMPQYLLGHLERLEQAEVALSRYGGLVLTGSAYRGVGIPDCIREGTVAAKKVVRYLSGERG